MFAPNQYPSSPPVEVALPSSGRLARFSHIAFEEALRSDMPVRHGAVLVRGGKALARGCNHSRNRLLGKNLCSVHAESKTARRGAHGCDLFVVRVAVPGVPERGRRAAEGGGEPVYKNSRPCAECVLILRNHGVARVFFSTGSGPSLAVMRLRAPPEGADAGSPPPRLRPGLSGAARGDGPPAFRGECFTGAAPRRGRPPAQRRPEPEPDACEP